MATRKQLAALKKARAALKRKAGKRRSKKSGKRRTKKGARKSRTSCSAGGVKFHKGARTITIHL